MRNSVKKEETKTTEKEVKQEFTLQEAFVLWKNKAKSGNEYLKGHDLNKNNLVGFFNTNKKNPKEPDIRVYLVNAEGKQEKEVASLWDYTSKNGKQYLSGSTDEKEKIVAWYGKKEKAPYIRAYFKEESGDLPFYLGG